MNEISLPRQRNLEKLRSIHQRSVCHHWDCDELVPLCAFAGGYPEDLRTQASHALARALSSKPVSASAARPATGFSIPHIREAELPDGVPAYPFVDDPARPSVFVVLVREEFDLSRQTDVAWDEVYAHVVKFRTEHIHRIAPIVVMQSPIRHYRISIEGSR